MVKMAGNLKQVSGLVARSVTAAKASSIFSVDFLCK